MVTSDDGGDRLRSRVLFGCVVVLSALCAVWGAFLVPLRIGTVPVPVAILLAAASFPLGMAGARLLESRVGAAVPLVIWLGVLLAATLPRREGDLVVLPSLTGYGFLLVGIIGASAPLGLASGKSRRPG